MEFSTQLLEVTINLMPNLEKCKIEEFNVEVIWPEP
jgi:hypothetical protein